MKTIPNKLTILRLILTPIFAFVFISNAISYEYRYCIAFVIFLLGMVTDLLDGIIARKYNCITEFGIVADPIADKILLMTAIILLASIHRLHFYVVIILILRDFLVSGIRILLAKYTNAGEKSSKTLAPPIMGKAKTVVETILVLYLLLYPEIKIVDYFLITATLVLSLISATSLIKMGMPKIKHAYYDYE